MNDESSNGDRARVTAAYPQEQLLVDAVGALAARRLLCTSPGLAQFAGAAAAAIPDATVSCLFLDAYRANLAAEYWCDKQITNLQIECAADFGAGPADVVALPLSAGGEAELARDLIQTGHERLRIGGQLFATSDKRDDTWLGEQLAKIFSSVTRRQADAGVLYTATKTEPLKKIKSYACEFAFRDRGRLIRAWSRPGVFSHRHIDPGARRLIDAMEIEPGMRVLDIGCGAGTVALAAACRSPDAAVHAVDSSARAVECTARGAALNELANMTTELNPSGNFRGAGKYDLALANPPYYSGFRIADHFLTAGRESLRSGGKVIVVTKHPAWYEMRMPELFESVTSEARKGYVVFEGVKA